MKLNGIARGDKTFRHFTFDDEDVIVKNNIPYYKVTYGKNPLEGEYGEEEINYIQCDQVMTLGGKKPKPIESLKKPEEKIEPEPIELEKKKRGRPSTKIKETTQNIQNTTGEIFEYCVEEFHSNNIGELQEQLNEMGKCGWELCGINTNKSLFGEIHIIVIFKRKK